MLHINGWLCDYGVKYFRWWVVDFDTGGNTITKHLKNGTNNYKTIHFGFVTISTIILRDKYAKNNGKKFQALFLKWLNVLKQLELLPPRTLIFGSLPFCLSNLSSTIRCLLPVLISTFFLFENTNSVDSYRTLRTSVSFWKTVQNGISGFH